MSFPLVCGACGAPSGPSTGVCPFCKTVSAKPKAGEAHGVANARKSFAEGDVPRTLALCAAIAEENPKALANVDFLLVYAKTLVEAEGPSSKIKSLLGKAYAIDAANGQVLEYLELVEARSILTKEKDDDGEKKLAAILRRSPRNVHALFLLGAHLFWVSGEPGTAIRYLERCVSLRPKFLRAWGCLGAAYERLGNATLAAKAYRTCVGLEREPGMKAFFKRKVAEAATA